MACCEIKHRENSAVQYLPFKMIHCAASGNAVPYVRCQWRKHLELVGKHGTIAGLQQRYGLVTECTRFDSQQEHCLCLHHQHDENRFPPPK